MKEPLREAIKISSAIRKIKYIVKTPKFKELWESKLEDKMKEELLECIEKPDSDKFCKIYYGYVNNDLDIMSRNGLRRLASILRIPYYGNYSSEELRRLIIHARNDKRGTDPANQEDSGGDESSH